MSGVLDIRIVDEAGVTQPAGTRGELQIRGASIMRGYWNRPDANDDTFVDGWMRTGDVAYVDAEGFVFIVDRIKDMIVSGGENIYSPEVESVISAHPQVAEVAVFGVPHPQWVEAVHAVVAPKPGETIDPDEVIAFTRERLAHYKCPKSVEVIDVLPRNPSGKILKRDLRAPHWEGRDSVIA